jgi:hypothetical protein
MSAGKRPVQILLGMLLVLLIAGCLPAAVLAQGGTKGAPTGTQTPAGTPGASEDSNEGTAWTIRQNYFKRFPWAKEFGPEGSDRVNGQGESESGGQITVDGPIYKWPEKHEGSLSVSLPSRRDEAIGKHLVKTFGLPISDTQFQVMSRLNDNMMLEEAFDPERWMWMENTMGAIKATSAANSAANLARNQAQGAIEFAQHFLPNFTADAGNVWNRIRNELFIPMAILLLLPGAVLSQVRAIVAQGVAVLGDVNPFDGIIRSIVAIFLIPATYLVVNYGIDVSNSIAHTIADGYTRVFGGDMYADAACAERRALAIRNKDTNKNAIPTNNNSQTQAPTGAQQDPFSQLEAISFDIGASEECGQNQAQNQQQGGGGLRSRRDARKIGNDTFGTLVEALSGGSQPGQDATNQGVQQGLNQGGQQQEGQADDGKADEQVPILVSTQRLAINAANAGLAATWNVLCAFQMAYLYYLFCIGPVVAALWVWPMNQLRGALPSWVEGVVTLCFWSLFWNTTILLMAAFKNVGETGTVIMTALNFLATASVKHAFDFAGLVKEAGAQVAKEAEKAGKGGGGGGGKGGGGKGGESGAETSGGGTRGGTSGTRGEGTGTETPAAPGTPGAAPAMVPASNQSGAPQGEGAPGGGPSKGLSASDVVPPPGERGGSPAGTGPGTGPDGGGDTPGGSGPGTQADASVSGPGGGAVAPPPLEGAQALAATGLGGAGDGGPGAGTGPGGGSGDGGPGGGGRGDGGGGNQSLTTSVSADLSGVAGSFAGALGGLGAAGLGAGVESAAGGAASFLGFSGTGGGTVDSGTGVPGGPGGTVPGAGGEVPGTGGGVVPGSGGGVVPGAGGPPPEARPVSGHAVVSHGGSGPGGGHGVPGSGGHVVPGSPGGGVLGDLGPPPVAAPRGDAGYVAPSGGVTYTPAANFSTPSGDVGAPPRAVPGAEPPVAPPPNPAPPVPPQYAAPAAPDPGAVAYAPPPAPGAPPAPVPADGGSFYPQYYSAPAAQPYDAGSYFYPGQQAPAPAPAPAPVDAPVQFYPGGGGHAPSGGAYYQAPAPHYGPGPAPAPAPAPHYESAPAPAPGGPAPVHYAESRPAPAPAPEPRHEPMPTYSAPVAAPQFSPGTRIGAGGGLSAALGRAASSRGPSSGGPGGTPGGGPAPARQGSLQEQMGQSGVKQYRSPQNQGRRNSKTGLVRKPTNPDEVELE